MFPDCDWSQVHVFERFCSTLPLSVLIYVYTLWSQSLQSSPRLIRNLNPINSIFRFANRRIRQSCQTAAESQSTIMYSNHRWISNVFLTAFATAKGVGKLAFKFNHRKPSNAEIWASIYTLHTLAIFCDCSVWKFFGGQSGPVNSAERCVLLPPDVKFHSESYRLHVNCVTTRYVRSLQVYVITIFETSWQYSIFDNLYW